MADIISIQGRTMKTGPCVGCSERSLLVRYEDEDGTHEDACETCLRSDKRGVKWLALARRVRIDPEFARRCFQQMSSRDMRDQFVLRFGTPWVRAC